MTSRRSTALYSWQLWAFFQATPKTVLKLQHTNLSKRCAHLPWSMRICTVIRTLKS